MYPIKCVRFAPESGPGEKGEPRPELNEHPRNRHEKGFHFPPTHSLMKRARSFISIFCCSARLVHSRIFCAFSCGIIFSGAVAFIGPGNCADAAFANIATPKDSAESNAIGRCRCIYVTQRPVLTKNYREGTQSATRLRNAHNVRFGSKADICNANRHVRFTPNSGHVQCKHRCPLSANSGHSARFIYWSHRADQLHMRERIMKLS